MKLNILAFPAVFLGVEAFAPSPLPQQQSSASRKQSTQSSKLFALNTYARTKWNPRGPSTSGFGGNTATSVPYDDIRAELKVGILDAVLCLS